MVRCDRLESGDRIERREGLWSRKWTWWSSLVWYPTAWYKSRRDLTGLDERLISPRIDCNWAWVRLPAPRHSCFVCTLSLLRSDYHPCLVIVLIIFVLSFVSSRNRSLTNFPSYASCRIIRTNTSFNDNGSSLCYLYKAAVSRLSTRCQADINNTIIIICLHVTNWNCSKLLLFRWEDIVLTTGEPVRNIDIVSLGRSPLSETDLLAASCNGLESLFAFFNVQISAVLLAITPDLHRSLDRFIVRLM